MTVADSASTETRMLGKSAQLGQLAMLAIIIQLAAIPTPANPAAPAAGRSRIILGKRGVKG